jgi:long-chain fatty acid transport protein
MEKLNHRHVLAAATFLLITSNAHAAGIWLSENGTAAMGTATAGRVALANDASTAFNNPAGMTRLDRSQLQIGLVGLDIHSEFSGQTTFPDCSVETAGNGNNIGSFTPVANLSYVHAVTPELRLGLTVGSYFGLALDYGDSWQGRYYVQSAELLTMGITPSVGYKVNHWFSVGGGATILYGKLKQDMAVNINPPGPRDLADGTLEIDSDDVSYGYNLGILIQPTKSSRVGVTYTSQVKLKFDDVASVENVPTTAPVWTAIAERVNDSKLDMEWTIPQAVNVSMYQQLTDKLAVMANVGWQDWSEFGNIAVDLSTPSTSGGTTIDAGFKDTWHGAIGLHYRFADPWLWQIGFAYDSSPVEKENRSVVMPLDRQYRYATGIEYTYDKDITLGFDYTFIDAGKSEIDQNRGPLAGHIVGEYDTNYINAFGLRMNWKF